MKHSQFTLDLSRPIDTSRSAFARAPANEAAMRLVEQWPDWPGPVVCIAGPAYSGKSHLALIWTELTGATSFELATLGKDDLKPGLAGAFWIDAGAGAPFGEEVLFHALNLAREEGGAILLTARKPPSQWNVRLPDLASRLKAVPVVEIAAPDDGLLEAILTKRFADIGVDADPAVTRFLLARMERTYEAVEAVVRGFDARTLAAQRRASVPLAAQVLEDIGNAK